MRYFVGYLVLELHLPQPASLKEKRSIIKSLISRMRNTFNVSVAEVGHLDLWQRSCLAVAVVSGEKSLVEKTFASVTAFVEQYGQGEVISSHSEIL